MSTINCKVTLSKGFLPSSCRVISAGRAKKKSKNLPFQHRKVSTKNPHLSIDKRMPKVVTPGSI